MSDTLASQVAAGEVVERPASVVKELMENALDAGAREIVVEVRKGGIALIKVRDDGCGMSRDDAEMSLQRHATSKLKTVEDLAGISTLGFRGEAVPSIASVSRFRLTTREKGADYGTEIVVEGGRLGEVREAGCAVGTEVEVKDLFFNVPARRKFLRTELTESGHVEHEVRMHALSSPGVRFIFRKDGRTVFDVPASKDARVRIGELDGRQLMRSMREVDWREGRLSVRGFVLPVEGARKSRHGQAMFLNDRPIDDRVIWRAVADAYGERLGKGMSPVAWLWLELPPESVDVNVHPAKREVRFHRPSEVRRILLEGVGAALRGERQDVFESTAQDEPPASPAAGEEATSALRATLPAEWVGREVSPGPEKKPLPLPDDSPSQLPPLPSREALQNLVASAPKPDLQARTIEVSRQEELPVETPPREGAESFRVLGCLHDRHLILEGKDGLVLMDPRNARERIVYERLLQKEGDALAQGLLVPVVLHLDARDAAVVFANRENFAEAGMEVEEFGGNTVQIRSAPDFLGEGEIEELVLHLVDELLASEGTRGGRAVAFESFAARFAKQGARGEKARPDTAWALLEDLFRCQLPYCTADGRPTLIHYSTNELERRFGRK
ncbi:DNA mismatch repair endonuclease MutL [Roseibacillus ishigakijimensis]|uniref:DNA mismatch repair protein MutL n=1 Tax=Roseibacillus ishigakijimensis TaxID=454146 RepID=A0A934VM52_9BACT|nr:DNA mismatch repair endonuclease MutL [Roseibacillus ishigakijimensis]MBK1833912.1 DNA mismatch repair endonuclease MutL [Roseibacillus ishigakijimensis]